MRTEKEISEAEDEMFDRVWFERKKVYITKLIDNEEAMPSKDVMDTMRKAYRDVEKKYGREELNIDDDFAWGFVNGKLSALRWVLGDDWDNLDT
jgi:hypothetical protein